MQKYMLNTVVLLGLTSQFSSVMAEKNNPQKARLDAVVVASDKVPTKDSRRIITGKDLEKRALDTPKYLFRDFSDINFERKNTGGVGSIRIRGMGGSTNFNSDRVAINVDGVPVTRSFVYGHMMDNGQNTFDTADLKTVEVQKGAADASGQNSGLAGTVGLVTKDPVDYLKGDNRLGGNIRSGYSSENKSLTGGFSLAGKLSQRLSSMFSYTYRNTNETPNYDGLDVIGKSRTAVNPIEAKSHNLLGKLVFSPSAGHTFKLKLENYLSDSKTEILQYPQAATASYYDKHKTNRKTFSLKYLFEKETPLFDSGQAQIYYQSSHQDRDNDFKSYNKKRGISSGHTKYKVKELGVYARFNKQIGNHQLGYGFNVKNTDVVTRLHYQSPGNFRQYQTQPDTKTQNYRFFISDDIALANGRFHLLPAVGLTRYVITPRTTPKYLSVMKAASHTVGSWSLGMTYDINDNHQLFGSYRKGFKVPSFMEQNPGSISAHGWSYVPNPNLKPEHSKSAELGLKSHGRFGDQTVSVFHDTYQNFIYGKKIRENVYKTSNNPNDVTIYGLEYKGSLKLEALGLFDGLKLKGALSYAKAREKTDKGNRPYTNGDPLSGNIGLAYDAPSENWGVSWTTHFAKAKRASDIAPLDLNPAIKWYTPVKPIGGYGVSDLTTYYKPTKDIQINAGVYNIFDKKYAVWSRSIRQNYDKVTEPGRYFAVNFRYEF